MLQTLKLNRMVSRSNSVDLDDSLAMKNALLSLDLYEVPSHGITEFPDEEMIAGIRTFQEDEDMLVDGVVNPDGPTMNALNRAMEARERSEAWAGSLRHRKFDFPPPQERDGEHPGMGTGGDRRQFQLAAETGKDKEQTFDDSKGSLSDDALRKKTQRMAKRLGVDPEEVRKAGHLGQIAVDAALQFRVVKGNKREETKILKIIESLKTRETIDLYLKVEGKVNDMLMQPAWVPGSMTDDEIKNLISAHDTTARFMDLIASASRSTPIALVAAAVAKGVRKTNEELDERLKQRMKQRSGN